MSGIVYFQFLRIKLLYREKGITKFKESNIMFMIFMWNQGAQQGVFYFYVVLLSIMHDDYFYSSETQILIFISHCSLLFYLRLVTPFRLRFSEISF